MKRFLKDNKSIAILLVFLFELIVCIIVTPDRYDSAFFISQMKEFSISDFIGMRYKTWTSRVLIEFVVCTVLTHNRLIWSILNASMMTLIVFTILKLFVKENDEKSFILPIFLILLYPIDKIAATCDWGAGTINYIWPFAMLLISCIPIKKLFNNEKIKLYFYPVYIFALIFACNQEQACAIAFGIYFVFIMLYILKNRKLHPFLVVQFIVILLSLIFIVTCPGNYERKNAEIQEYFMEYGSFGLIDKITLGIVATAQQILVNNDIVFLVFSIISASYIFVSYKNSIYRIVALIPVVLSLIFGICYDIICGLFPYFGMFSQNWFVNLTMLNSANYTNLIYFVPLLISLILFVSVLMNILIIFKNLNNNLAVIIYLIGLASRIMMGFSPTIFASQERTFMFFEFSLIIVSILIWQEFQKQDDKYSIKARNKIDIFVKILSILECANTVLYAFISQM